jgi:aerobic-type carbon monoxide dehydrogenase small subunit (CoxS/CutS family)
MKTPVTLTLNGYEVRTEVGPGDRLIDLLRGTLGLTGTKEGCGEGECGACTVILGDRPVNSCLYPALEVEGQEVLTVEGLLGPDNQLSVIQQAFVEQGAIQCGFCTPGMIMSTRALLDARPDPTDEEIREALAGNLCRCTGYIQILAAVRQAALRLGEAKAGGGSP